MTSFHYIAATLLATGLLGCAANSPIPQTSEGPANPAALEGPPITASDILNPSATFTAKIPTLAGAPTDLHALYTCSMHPQILQDHPGICPICGMSLILKPAPSQGSHP